MNHQRCSQLQLPLVYTEKSKLLAKTGFQPPNRSCTRRIRTLLVATGALFILVFIVVSSLPKNEAFKTYRPRHWKSASTPIDGWVLVERAPLKHRVHLVVAVHQSNLNKLEDLLLRVSDPDNVANYGSHLSLQEVNTLTAPPQASVNVVIAWLKQAGIRDDEIHSTGNSDLISAVVSIARAEKLLSVSIFFHFCCLLHIHKVESHFLPFFRLPGCSPLASSPF
jgi:tripeptidyl-peptidase-1